MQARKESLWRNLLGVAYALDKEVWQVIDERINAPTQAGP